MCKKQNVLITHSALLLRVIMFIATFFTNLFVNIHVYCQSSSSLDWFEKECCNKDIIVTALDQ